MEFFSTLIVFFILVDFFSGISNAAEALRPCYGYSNSTRSSICAGSRVHNTESKLVCRMTVVHTTFELFRMESLMKTESTILCIPILDGREQDEDFHVFLPDSILQQYSDALHRGTLVLEILKPIYIGNEILNYTKIRKLKTTSHGFLRQIQEAKSSSAITGTVRINIVRVSTSDSNPQSSLKTLEETLFGDSAAVSFKTQMRDCSFGQLHFQLANAYDVKVPRTVSNFFGNHMELITMATQILKDQLNTDNLAVLADKTFFCLPPGTGTWAASAGIWHWRAQFNDEWCTSLSATMHEVGHLFGLGHANDQFNNEYKDMTDQMSGSFRSPVSPRKCFNGYNLFRWGWTSQTRYLEVSRANIQGGLSVVVAAFVDYPKSSAHTPVLLNVVNQYFLLYNYASDFNAETGAMQNQITITQPNADGSSRTVVGLEPRNRFVIKKFSGSSSLIIEACAAHSGSDKTPRTVSLSIGLDTSYCGPTLQLPAVKQPFYVVSIVDAWLRFVSTIEALTQRLTYHRRHATA
jgi:hypothetical protein